MRYSTERILRRHRRERVATIDRWGRLALKSLENVIGDAHTIWASANGHRLVLRFDPDPGDRGWIEVPVREWGGRRYAVFTSPSLRPLLRAFGARYPVRLLCSLDVGDRRVVATKVGR